MSDSLQQRAIQRLVRQGEDLGVEVPQVVRDLAAGHGCSNGGAIAWERLHPDEDVFRGCCWGEEMKGAAYCTCWVPEFDLEQAEPVPPTEPIQVRPGGLCGDCAYRPGSPELADGYMAETLRELPLKGETFWCHDGLRRAVRWRHPDGRTVDAAPGDYQPPMVDGRPHRADGRVGVLCAGWAACSRRWDNLSTKQNAATTDDEFFGALADELDQTVETTRDRLAGGELERRRAAIMDQVRDGAGLQAHQEKETPDRA